MAMKPISFEKDGFPQLLRTEAACRKAVERGDIQADTWVLAYGEGEQRSRMRAADHPTLAPLFRTPEPPVAASPPDAVTPAAVPDRPDAPPIAQSSGISPTAAPGRTNRAPAPERPQPEPAPSPSLAETPSRPNVARPTRSSGDRNGPVVVLLVAAVVIFFVIRAMVSSDKRDPVPAPTATNAAAQPTAEPSPTPTPVVLDQRYAVREVSVRAQPCASAAQLALVPRGTLFAGVIVPSANDPAYTWLEIREGPNVGGFVSTLNLAVDMPPDLDTAESGVRYVTQDIVPLERPEQNAQPKDSAGWQLTAGAQVELAGVIDRGVFFSGWGEIMLPKRTGVGYVPVDRLTTTAPEPPEEPAAALPESSAPPPPARRSTAYTLSLTNECRKRISLLVRYLDSDGWQATMIDLRPGGTAVLGDSTPGGIISDQIQFAFYSVDGVIKRETGTTRVTVRGEPFYLRPMKVDRRGANILAAGFTCSG